jgi:hypothetical protein
VLGNFKIEDSCGCEKPEAVYVTNKVYALRNPVTGKEKVKSKGVPQWLCSDDKEGFKERRTQINYEKMSFNDMLNLTKGIPYKFTLI